MRRWSWSESRKGNPSARLMCRSLMVMATSIALATGGGMTWPSADPAGAASYGNGVDLGRILYGVDNSTSQSINFIDLAGTNPVTVKTFPVGIGQPTIGGISLSPDGSKILFTEDLNIGPSVTIDTINSDGTGLATVPVPPGSGLVGGPAWSPDGVRIAFTATGDHQPTGLPSIWVENLDGSNAIQVSTAGASPTWSPDGSELAYSSGGGIYEVPSSGGPSQRIGVVAGAAEDLHWSPDGAFIEFLNPSASLASADIDVLNVMTGIVTTLFTSTTAGSPTFGGSIASLNWTPDSSHFFTTWGGITSGTIVEINLQGQIVSSTGVVGSGAGSALPRGLPRDGSPVTGLTANTTGTGYRMATADGGVLSYGTGLYFGGMGGTPLNRPVVGMAATPDGAGYWEVASDGGIFSFGDADFYGSMGGRPLNQPIVGMAATPSGGGYWLVAKDGGIFSFGDALFLGSMGSARLNQPVVGMASSTDGHGYWLVASDGGTFSYGDAIFCGSTGSIRLNRPIVGMATAPSGGYWLVGSDGGVFSFGNAGFFGSKA